MSSQDLFQLLNQLQTVEKTLINILLEAAIKLTSLTESNIFVLVETPEERKFAGSSTLCQSFVDGELRYKENDIQLEVNAARCDVVEKQAPGGIHQMSISQPKTKKRGSKRKGNPCNATKEKIPKIVHPNPPSEIRENGDGANGDEVIIEDIRSWDDELANAHDENDTTLSGDQYDCQFPADLDAESQYFIGDDETSEIKPELGVGEADGDFGFGQETEWDETFNSKISALLALEPTNCFIPQSEEQKLFHSVMYDLARQMVATADVAQHGPNSPNHRAHFKKCLEEFLKTYLTNFLSRVPAGFRVNKKGRMFTPMAIIRKCCNDCFRALLRRKFRQVCLASNTPIPFQFH